MRLGEWRASAPSKEAGSSKVAASVDPVLSALGAEADPHCWIVWGEEPGVRHTILVPTAAGLVTCFVRVNVSGEGPRPSAKLVRWNRVELGELAMETSAGHRLLSFQIEGHVLQGADAGADRIAAFALEVFAMVDGRPRPDVPVAGGRRAASAMATASTPRKPPTSRPATVVRGASGSGR